MKSRCLRALAVHALVLSCALSGASILDDRFTDSNSQNQDLPNNSIRLFNGRAGTVRTDAPGSASFRIVNAGGSEAVWGFFTEQGAPVKLGVGDKLTVSLTFELQGFPANSQDVRFGVLDSLGTRTTANLTGGMNHTSFVDDPGYGMQFYPSGTGDAFVLSRRTNLTSGNVFNTFADFTVITSGATERPARKNLLASVPYTLTYSIERLSANETRITAAVEGEYWYSVVESSATPQTSFDYFGFRVTGAAFADEFRFSRVLIDYTPAPPVITSQPQPSNLTVQVGSDVTMAAGASGSEISYQWNKDGQPLAAASNPSAATPTLTLTNVQLAAAGLYTLTVSNGGGSVTSDPVTLRVSTTPVPPAPRITTQPANTNVTVGEEARLSVVATGAGLIYQWFRNGVLLPGATAASLVIPNAQVSDSATYSVVVSNSSGSIASAPARLLIVSAMSAVDFAPGNGAAGTCVDGPIRVTFSELPAPGRSGVIRIVRADGTAVDTIDLSATSHTRLNGGTAFNYSPVLIEGHTASIYPSARLAPNQTYTVEIGAGAFLDPNGAPFGGLPAASWKFSTRTALPASDATLLTVAADGSGDYCSVQAAIDHVPANNPRRVTIAVKRGYYDEIVYVPSNKPNITVRGEYRWETVIRYANNANRNSSQRQLFGVDAPDFTLETITLINTTPRGGSQAEAFRGNNQRIVLNSVDLKSFQDTLWLQGLGYVYNTYIEGDVDFMWGNGSVLFRDSEFRMVTSNGYYTQIRNPQDRPGNVYLNCRFSAAPGVTGGYLSRVDPGVYPYSQMVLIDSIMGAHVRPEGWLINNATAAPAIQFWEFNSRDDQGNRIDVAQRAAYSKQLTDAEAARWRDPSATLGAWNPSIKLSAAIVVRDLTRFYNGAAQSPTILTDPPGLRVNLAFAGRSNAPTAPGTYEFTVAVEDAEYQGSANGVFTIRQAPVSITLGNLTQTADGTPKRVTVAANPAAAPIAVTYNGSANPPSEPGRYSVVAAVTDDNYRGRASAILAILAPGPQPVTAFPGAEGKGALARGGRGGDVYRVTNLNDSGPGSLRNGILTANGPRTIVFDVSGTIRLQSRLNINKPYLTIAGQTAPGGGITISGWNTVVGNTNNVVIRYVRFRMGDIACPAVQDDALWVDRSTDVILDHVSASWSVDETLSVTESDRVTVQWSMITESLRNSCHEKGAHGYGSLLRYGAGEYTFHHNLWAHHDSRNPRIGDELGVDFVNNVVYNWGSFPAYSGGNEEGVTRVNMVGNYYLAGPQTPASRVSRIFDGGGTNTQIYQSNNRVDGTANAATDGEDTDWAMFVGDYTRREESRFDISQTETETPETALARVRASAGASLVRDAVDQRVIQELDASKGAHIDSQTQVGGWPALATATAPKDADGDGMPDDWETARGLNPASAADGAMLAAGGSGYTNLELYLASLVERRPGLPQTGN